MDILEPATTTYIASHSLTKLTKCNLVEEIGGRPPTRGGERGGGQGRAGLVTICVLQ